MDVNERPHVQALLRHAFRHPWPLCGFIPETEGLSRIYTGLEKRKLSAFEFLI
jgi:hypothetical protein